MQVDDHDGAVMCAMWAAGLSQRMIAAHFGLRGPAPVSIAIGRWLSKWSDCPLNGRYDYAPGMPCAQGANRRVLVERALLRFESGLGPPVHDGESDALPHAVQAASHARAH